MEQVRGFLTPRRKEELVAFVDMLKKHPEVLQAPELSFFKSYLVELGAKIPEPAPAPKPEPAPAPAPAAKKEEEKPKAKAEEDDEMPGLEEDQEQPKREETPAKSPSPPMPEEAPDTELMAADTEMGDLEMGDRSKEVTEAEMDAANETKSMALAAQSEGRDAEAVKLFTEAIMKNPRSAILYASRANVLLRMRRPSAAIRDCDTAIAMNPDSAKPYKVRGKARRFLGMYAEAKKDLQMGNKLDFDEGTFEMQKWLEERLKAKELHEARVAARERRKEEERREKEREEAMKRRQQAQQHNHDEDMPDASGEMPAGMDFLNDPEIMAAMSDPTMQAKLMEVLSSQDPMKLAEAQKDPKLARILQKIAKGAAGMKGEGGHGHSHEGCGCGGHGGASCDGSGKCHH